MGKSAANTVRLPSRMARLEWRTLLVLFGAGAVMSALSLAIPPFPDAPNGQLGQLLFGALAVVDAVMVGVLWVRPSVLRSSAFDVVYLVAGNFSVVASATGETMMFGSQTSLLLVLWPFIIVSAFRSRSLFRLQLAVGAAEITLLLLMKSVVLDLGWAWVGESVVVVVGAGSTAAAIAFFRWAAEAEAAELERVVHLDPLTGLSNRRDVERRFSMLLAQTPPGGFVALVMADLDHFKSVNDRSGHAAGDEVLQAFAAEMREHARAGDVTARLGGEEFLWVTPAASSGEVLERVDRLRRSFPQRDGARQVTVSCGIALSGPDAHPTLSGLLDRADAALYRAKKAGRDRVESDGPGDVAGAVLPG